MRSIPKLACAALLAALSAAPAHAVVTYAYTGAIMSYTPRILGVPNGLDTSVIGTATFDETIVTSTFTGFASYLSSTLGTDLLAPAATGISAGLPPPIGFAPGASFTNGQITGWNLFTTITNPALNLTAPIVTSTSGDSVIPLTGQGGSVFGSVSST